MEEHGVVVEDNGAIVLIRAKKTSACDSCASSKSCHSVGEEEMLVEADDPVGAHVGDRVAYEVKASAVIKAGMLLYLVPLLSFIGGLVLGSVASTRYFTGYNPDLVSGLFGAAFLAGAFIGLKLYGRRLERDRSYRPYVLKVL
jgi:sigma-E factor negative regulatory protein RseC